MLKNAPIFLDEATANVAPENGKKLMDAIEALTREKTVVTRARRRKTFFHKCVIFQQNFTRPMTKKRRWP